MRNSFCVTHQRRAMARQSHRFPLTGVNWNSGVVLGDIVPCYYPGCERKFPNHTDLTEHLFKDHSPQAGRVDALNYADVLAAAEAILAGHMPAAEWPWSDGGDQVDENQGSTKDDPDPEPEAGTNDDSASNDTGEDD